MATDLIVPTPEALIWPALCALKELGGSASHQELLDKVVELEKIPDDVQNVMHAPSAGWTKLSFNLGGAKIRAGKIGILDVRPITKGLWIATEKGKTVTEEELRRLTEEGGRKSALAARSTSSDKQGELEAEPKWKSDLLQVLTSIPPDAFERLAQLLLRASGFIKVEVAGKTGDGGIDGSGVLRVSELLSFHVYFQCKRYKGTVPSSDVRNFRGAISGRSDKGLFVTTGTFTAEAKKEANRDGVSPIDLIDGDRLCELLKNLGLGVNKQIIEEVTVDPDWFNGI